MEYLSAQNDFEAMKSQNEEMQRCLELAKAASQTTANVLIIGENGTQKERIARAIHTASSRSGHEPVIFPCKGMPAEVLENDLFGYEAGAIAGAEKMRRGKIELAHNSTIIIDDISELPLSCQAKLARLLEHGDFERSGSETRQMVDVRVIALSSKILSALVADKLFNGDLFYRLNEIVLAVPPLRHRREDLHDFIDEIIKECNNKFGKNVKEVSQIAMDYLLRYDFPGNLPELKSLIKRAVTIAKSETLWMEDLGMRVEVPSEAEIMANPEEMLALSLVEKRHIQHVLNYTKGNKKRTAELLQVSRPTLDRKIKVFNLRLP